MSARTCFRGLWSRLGAVLVSALGAGACNLLVSLDGLEGPPLGSSGAPPASGGAPSGGTGGQGGTVASEGGAAGAAGLPASGGTASGGTGNAGGNAGEPFPWLTTTGEPRGLGISATHVYWVEHSPSGVFRAALASSPASERVDGVSDAVANPFDIAVQGDTLYVTNGPGNEVLSRLLGGGPLSTLFSGAGRAAYLAVASDRAYVTAFDAAAPDSGSVVRGPEPEIISLLLYPDQPGSAGIAVAKDGLYWGVGARGASPGAILAAPLSGSGAPTERVTAEGPVFGVAVDDEALFWTTEDAVWRAARADLKPGLVYRHDSELGAGDVALTPSHVYVAAPRLRALLRFTRP